MATQLLVRLAPETKSKLSMPACAEGKNTSQVVRELIESYIQNRDMASYIDDLWNRVGDKLRARGIRAEDIEKAIRDSRASKK